MGHRQLFFPSPSSNMDCADIWNHPYPYPHLQQGTAAMGVHPMPYFDISLRSNNHPSSNFNFEIPNHNTGANPGALHNPFPHPTSASIYPIPPNYIQGGPSCYNEFPINSQMDIERAHFKRKNPAIYMAYDSGNSYNYPCAVNSQGNPTSGPQYLAWDPNCMPSSYENNSNQSTVEGSHRNVRSRQSFALHFGNNQAAPFPPSNLPYNLHPASNFSGQWGHPPPLAYNGSILPSGAVNFNGSNTNLEIDGRYHHNPLHNTISTPPLPNLSGPYPGHSSYDQRTHPSRATSTHQSVGSAAPLADGTQPGIEAVPPSRHSRPVAITGRSSERNGRSRGLYDRFQQFSYGNNAHSEWISDGRAFYDSRNLFDQHREMRLDIDNMSYEELLALEERIGNVNTGLSGDTIPKCFVEITHCSLNQVQDEKNCIICLEVYKDTENIGKLACGHEFHSNCIKKWLSIKNACPICKASALPDNSKEKLTVSR